MTTMALSPAPRLSLSQVLIASWGVFCVVALLGQALYRLTPLAIEPVEKGMLSRAQWAVFIGWAIFNAYAEGYRGFQKAFVPRVVARAFHLARHPKPLHVILAGPFCMAMFHAKKKNLILAWGVFFVVVALVILVRSLSQPWRGIVDVGVVVGLGWGTLSLLIQFATALATGEVPETDSLPEADPASSAA
ncbi:MAG: hypothetical protein AAGA56_05360 [Myxococcota bacterium]